MGEGPCVPLKRGLGGVEGYDFKGGGREQRSLCGEGVELDMVEHGGREGKL